MSVPGFNRTTRFVARPISGYFTKNPQLGVKPGSSDEKMLSIALSPIPTIVARSLRRADGLPSKKASGSTGADSVTVSPTPSPSSCTAAWLISSSSARFGSGSRPSVSSGRETVR